MLKTKIFGLILLVLMVVISSENVYAFIPEHVNVAEDVPEAPSTVSESSNTALKVTVGEGNVSLNRNSLGNSFEAEGSTENLFKELFSRAELAINIIAGLVSLTFILLFIKQFIKLGGTAANPQARSQALSGLLWLGIAVMISGSLSIYLAIAIGIFN